MWDCANLLKGDAAVNPHTSVLSVLSMSVRATQTQPSWLYLAPQVLKYYAAYREAGRMLERIRRKLEKSSPENRGETRPSNGFRCKWEILEKKPEASSTQLLPCPFYVSMASFRQKTACNIGSASSSLCIRTGSHQTVTHKPSA